MHPVLTKQYFLQMLQKEFRSKINITKVEFRKLGFKQKLTEKGNNPVKSNYYTQ